MSGETEREVSGWTVDTLHSHILRLIHEKDRQYEQRFRAQQEAVTLSLAAAEKAVSKAEMASEKRFDGVNEFRQALADSTRQNVTRQEYDAAHQNVVEKIESLTRRVERWEGTATGTIGAEDRAKLASNRIVAAIIASVGVVVAAAGLAVAILTR